ncbi:MAG TPA: tartrate-resistant acid phosphatase type 5 family protein [Verrucomicrobiae bacterium]|nr:tartrate-resistant acid phosphatase type 5 family protein [Verrucomicrobiae bacterium]
MMKQSRREFVRTLFVATQAVMVGQLLPGTLHAAAALASEVKPDGLNFLIFGDWGRNGQKDQVEVAAQMATAAQAVGAKFIVSVGDNFYNKGVASVDDPQWQTSFEKVYSAPSLQVPWQVILGNHDYCGNCDAQVAYGKTSPRWKMPARYYVQSEKIDAATTVDFFYLDTSPLIKSYRTNASLQQQLASQDREKQLAWFKAALAASRAQWKIVVAHHPIYSGGEHGDMPDLIESVLPLLHEHKVQAYFNGHDHDLQHLQAGEVNLFCSGAGSLVRPTRSEDHTKFAMSCPGFTTVNLQAGRMNVQMIDSHGARVYATTVPRVS